MIFRNLSQVLRKAVGRRLSVFAPVIGTRCRAGRAGALTAALASALLLFAAGSAFAQQKQSDPFELWLQELRLDALAQGISQTTLERTLTGLRPLDEILERDRAQPEFLQTFWTYLDRAVNDRRIRESRERLAKHGKLLSAVHKSYGVQPRFLVAFWALESDFGRYTGGFSVIRALATLAYDPRRSDFFRRELLTALAIVDAGHIAPEKMSGSWAGAMGQLQFMPSTFAHYAVDRDGDRHIDIWNSLPDIFASAANYLAQLGWDDSKTWGREVRLPKRFDWSLAGLDTRKSLAQWQTLGVRRANGGDLPAVAVEASLLVPAGHHGPAFLVYENFRRIMTWNRSINYALAIGHLSDRMTGGDALVAKEPAGAQSLRYKDVVEIQTLLREQGFAVGQSDGIVGSRTRAAISAFQEANGMIPDGYPTLDLLTNLRQKKGNEERSGS